MATPSTALDRLLQTPQLARVVPRLAPALLHRTIEHFGLEDCAELVALATPAQIAGMLDIDLWHARAGADEAFDPERFAAWLNVLMESGAAVAADKLSAVDADVAAAAFAGQLAVFDAAAVSPYISLEGDLTGGRESTAIRSAEIGAYFVEAMRMEAWDAIVELLTFLEGERTGEFTRLMRRCVHLTSSDREEDGFHALLQDRDQHIADISAGRDERRETQGFISAAQARAFLHGARTLSLATPAPPVDPISRSYFRSLALAMPEDEAPAAAHRAPANDAVDEAALETATIEVVEMLSASGVLAPPARALLGAADESRLALVEAHITAHASAPAELAYLANVLIAGCALQGRAFTPAEAADAAAATCNLGLTRWPDGWPSSDLVTAFQVGWQVLHLEVCLFAARELRAALEELPRGDRDVQMRLIGLRRKLDRAVADGMPWDARPALEAILRLDAPAWAGLNGLIDECPVLHAVVQKPRAARAIEAGDFGFVAGEPDLAVIRSFLCELPRMFQI